MKIFELYRSINSKNVESFIIYTSSLFKKEYKLNGINRLIFKKKWQKKEYEPYCRANIRAALVYLDFLVKNHDENFESNVRNCLADLYPFYKEIFPNLCDKNDLINVNQLSSFLHFDIAKSLFYKNTILPKLQKKNYIDLPVVYLLRLCLESKVYGILGIDYIHIDNSSTQLSKILEIVPSLKTIEFSSQINWSMIQDINDWINHFMHRNLRPFPWTIHFAFQQLEPFFKVGSRNFGNTVSHSVYASAFLENKDSYIREIQQKFKELYPEKEVKIKWRMIQEVHLKK